MAIYNQLQPPAQSLTGCMLSQLSQIPLLSNNTILDGCTEKVSAYAIRLLLVTPLLTLCAAADLTVWALKTVCVYPVYLSGVLNHLITLVTLITFPILALLSAVANRLPTPYTPSTTQAVPRSNTTDNRTPTPLPPQTTHVTNIAQPPRETTITTAAVTPQLPMGTAATPPTEQAPPSEPTAATPPTSAVIYTVHVPQNSPPPPAESLSPPPPPKKEHHPKLTLAVLRLDVELVRKLLTEQNADPSHSDGHAPLCALAKINPSKDIYDMPKMLAIANLLLDNGAPIHQQSTSLWNAQSQSPLIWSIWYGHYELAELFLKRNANPNVDDGTFKNYTPLTAAITGFFPNNEQKVRMIELLLNNKALPDQRGYENKAPLDFAVEQLGGAHPEEYAYFQWRLLLLLLQHGAKPCAGIRDDYRNYPGISVLRRLHKRYVSDNDQVVKRIAETMLADTEVIKEGTLKNCTPKALATVLCAAGQKLNHFCAQTHATDTFDLPEVWQLLKLLDENPTIKNINPLRELMQKHFAHEDSVFQNPYLQAILLTQAPDGWGDTETFIFRADVRTAFRQWIEKTCTEAIKKTIAEMDSVFAVAAPEMSKDLQLLITSYLYPIISTDKKEADKKNNKG